MDLVVPVRSGAVNQQLRYALRSWVAHLPHRHVWVIGYRPPWVDGVRYLATPQTGTKYVNTTRAVAAACRNKGVSDPFVLLNDDFFVMQPLPDGVPTLHRGPVREVEAYYSTRGNGSYLQGLRETRDLLVSLGHEDPLSYELHVPLVVHKEGMLHALDVGRRLDVLHKRTAYGNLARIGGEQVEDCKILWRGPQFPTDGPFLSTMPDAFSNGMVGVHIRRTFPRPCRYESGGGGR
ncbi:hypothetical protein [Streptomyces variegatus]|uniref:hypothetical protein n=1 Tax=Streptomyces variegatus TaxID=284040 RepID=UPI003C2AB4B7